MQENKTTVLERCSQVGSPEELLFFKKLTSSLVGLMNLKPLNRVASGSLWLTIYSEQNKCRTSMCRAAIAWGSVTEEADTMSSNDIWHIITSAPVQLVPYYYSLYFVNATHCFWTSCGQPSTCLHVGSTGLVLDFDSWNLSPPASWMRLSRYGKWLNELMRFVPLFYYFVPKLFDNFQRYQSFLKKRLFKAEPRLGNLVSECCCRPLGCLCKLFIYLLFICQNTISKFSFFFFNRINNWQILVTSWLLFAQNFFGYHISFKVVACHPPSLWSH